MFSTCIADALHLRDANVNCAPNALSTVGFSASGNNTDPCTTNTFASDWKDRSEEAALEAEPRLVQSGLGKSALLLVILSFLNSSQITTSVLHRGGTPRKRWSESGEMKEVTAFQAGLVDEVIALLSNDVELDLALRNLLAISAIKMEPLTTGQPVFTLDDQIQTRVSERLSSELKTFWRHQALLLVSHGFPRRYLDSE